ncbi:MAG: START domain-containing protein [Myxococcota bacterium]
MRLLGSVVPILIGLLAVPLMVGRVEATGSDDWQLAKQADGIDVHTRPVPGSGVVEFRGRAEVDASVEAVFAVLQDVEGFRDWFPDTLESRLLERKERSSVRYSVLDAPWPLSDRDHVLRTTSLRDSDTGAIRIAIVSDPTFHPEQPGRVRIRVAQGSWALEPLDGGRRTRVTFAMHLDPGGGLPDWLVNARIVGTPFEALTNLRARVGRKP